MRLVTLRPLGRPIYILVIPTRVWWWCRELILPINRRFTRPGRRWEFGILDAAFVAEHLGR